VAALLAAAGVGTVRVADRGTVSAAVWDRPAGDRADLENRAAGSSSALVPDATRPRIASI